MASNFYIVHHEFRAGSSSKWWETAYAAMAPGGGWDEAVAANKEKGFFNHSANAVTANGCLLYTSPSPRDQRGSRMPSSA